MNHGSVRPETDESRVFIVTGAGRGIGRAISERLLAEGHRVLGADLEIKAAASGLQGVTHTSREEMLQLVKMDVAEDDAGDRLVERGVSAFGGVDGLVNCAGIFPTSPALEIGVEDWDSLMAVNLRAPFFLSQAVARYLIKDERPGVIVNVSSSAAGTTRPGIAHYSASKAALTMLTRSLAVEWAEYGIRVNAVAPGLVESPGVEELLLSEAGQEEHRRKIANIPAKRPGSVGEVARCVAFLLSENSSYVTGHALAVDGGYSAGRTLQPLPKEELEPGGETGT